MSQDRIGRFNDLLTLVDVFTVDPAYSFADRLILTDIFTYEHINSFSHIQTLRESYTRNINTTRTFTDNLIIRNTFTGSTNNLNTIQNPIPPVDNPDQNNQPDPGPSPGPGLGPFTMGLQRYAVQTVHFSGASDSVTIKAPDFGDKETDQPTIINEETRNLVRIQYRDKIIWHDFVQYDLAWSQLDEDEAALIRVFLRRTCGQGITYFDIYGNSHVGVIPDPDQPVTSSDKGYSIKFTFLEGTLAT